MQIQPYLYFGGRCEEAIAFYEKAVGAKREMVMYFKDAPTPPPPGALAPGMDNKIMHASLKIGNSTVLASDGDGKEKTSFQGFSLTLLVPTVAEAEKFFGALAEGGRVKMPVSKTFFSPGFGMLEDRFGLGWIVIVES